MPVSVAIDLLQNALLGPIDDEAAEHRDHRQSERQGGRVERQGKAVGHGAERLFQHLGRHAGDGPGDAENRAEEPEDRNGPGDEAD